MKELINKYKHLIRFVVVGCLNTLVDFGVYSILTGAFGIYYAIAQVVSYSSGTLNSYIFNKFWTFDDTKSKKKTTHEMVQFIVINLISLSVSLLGLKILKNDFQMNNYIAKVIVTVIAQVVNFCGYKFWVFK